jgi:hypothetical protein
MANPNAIVGSILAFEPALDRPPAELLRADRGLSVELAGGQRLRLDPVDSRSVGFAESLERLRKLRRPVYLEFDSTSAVITRLLVPHVARVVGMRSQDRRVVVELHPSHGRHVLNRDNPDFAEMERLLSAALRGGDMLIISEDHQHNIIDVRSFRPGPDGPLPPEPIPEPEFPWPPLKWVFDWLQDLWRWHGWPWKWFTCISMERAQQVFDAMNATSCDPLTVPEPCIPFLFPDDGCWARAHEMCRLMIDMGLIPRKVWNEASDPYDSLHVNTRNHPDCAVWWTYHVAPTLCVRGAQFFQTEQMVIDPSLFTTPVSKAVWKDKQQDPTSTLNETDASIYGRTGGTDPSYISTKYYLEVYRTLLQLRAIEFGPPPYANCP